MNRKKWLIISLISISTISALFEGLFYLRGLPSTPATATLAGVLSPFLLVLWIDADDKDHRQVGRPFDYGFLVLMFLVPYLPYYLWRTRGAAGLLMCAGFLGLFLMGFLVQSLIYCFYYL
jgi:hypothetical protein